MSGEASRANSPGRARGYSSPVGRCPHHAPFDEPVTAIRCDHRHDEEVDAACDRVVREAGAIDVLVNSVWGGYERMIDNGAFTWSQPFWQQPLWRWDAMFAAGVRAHYAASQCAARTMVPRRRGLIVNISFWAARKHIGNVAYGVAKAATDKMTADMATELAPHGVTVVSLYPGSGAHRIGDAGRRVPGPEQL